jgi:hypothetical protein
MKVLLKKIGSRVNSFLEPVEKRAGVLLFRSFIEAVCLKDGGDVETGRMTLERVMGIEPTSQAWEARILPLNNTRMGRPGERLAKW